MKENKEDKLEQNKDKKVFRSLTGPMWILTPEEIVDAIAWAQKYNARLKWSLEQLERRRSK
jgi:hypothetical protein